MRFFRICLLLFTASSVCHAADEPRPVRLAEVVVKAKPASSLTVSETDAAAAVVRRIAGGAGVLSVEEYRDRRATTVQDALAYAPGVYAQTRTGGEESRVSIRGSGIQRTFHLRGITLLQDGLPLNEADGGGDFQRIEPLASRYVEIFRGGNALRYGSTSLGGAVNFVSPTGHDADILQTRLEWGSDGYVRSQVSTGQVFEKFDYYASLSQFRQDGYRLHSTQDAYKVLSNFGWRFTDTAETRFYFSYVEAKAKLPGSLRRSQLGADPRQASASAVSLNQKRDFDYVRLANKTSFVKDERRLDFDAWWFNIDLYHPIFRFFDVVSDNFGGGVQLTDASERFGRPNEFVIGARPSASFFDDSVFSNVGGEKGPVAFVDSDRIAYNLDLYAEDRFYFLDRTAFVAGLALNYASRDSKDHLFTDGDDSGRQRYRGISPKAGLLHELDENSQAFVNYNRSFEPPTFAELFDAGNNFVPTEAQTADTVETGLRGRAGDFAWDATYYHSWVDAELLGLNDAAGNSLGTVNVASGTVHRGVEFGGQAPLGAGFVLHGAFDWNDFRFDGDPVFNNNRLPGIPEYFFRAELSWRHPCGFYVCPNAEWTFEKYPIDMANTFYADRYAIWGFRAGWKRTKGPSVFFEAKNLEDRAYAASTGVVADARGADTNAIFNPGNGRAFFGGVEWRW